MSSEANGRKGFSEIVPQIAPEGAGARPFDGATFFDSYYRALKQDLTDRGTIGNFITELDSRFHYNATENAIIRAIARLEGLPRGQAVRTWEFMRRRQDLRSLDIGSGAGHWIEFHRDALSAMQVVGCEIAPPAVQHLQNRYKDQPGIAILQHDIARTALPADVAGDGFDYITAIGVMFHIVDDALWRAAIANLALVIKPGGLIFIGGEFGPKTRNVQFHSKDTFSSFDELRPDSADAEVRVNKRVRSLSDWHKAIATTGLSIADLIRTESDWSIMTPENDVLVLQR